MKKKLLALGLAGMMAFSLTACGNTESSNSSSAESTQADAGSSSGEEATNEIVIGFSAAALRDDFAKHEEECLQLACDNAGITLIETDANNDAQQQIADFETLITKGAKAIIVRPVDTEAVATAYETANAQGVYVVCLEGGASEDSYDAAVGLTDQGEHGRLLGEYIQAWLDEDSSRVANVGYINGMVSDLVNGRKDGIFETCPSANLVAEQIADWTTDKAMAVTEDWLQTHPEINVIACMNDEMAVGAIQALTAAGKDFDDYLVLGVDGSVAGQQYIRSGELDATTYQDTYALTESAVETAVGLLNGETYTEMVQPENMIALMDSETIDELVG